MKDAHITSRPAYQVGDKVLGICGTPFKVKRMWADVEPDRPICRSCVETAIAAMNESDGIIEAARQRSLQSMILLRRMDEALNPDSDTVLDLIAENDRNHINEVVAKQVAKRETKRMQHTCTCLWVDGEISEIGDDCPIHGLTGHDESEPVKE